ncbi:MAG: MFS transporter [Egibacteraceae bacterium]
MTSPDLGVPVDVELGEKAPGGGVWSRGRRRLTFGLVMTITLVAFESLAISTVMPVVADDLGGLGLYGWVFSGFFLGSLLGIVLAGRAADRRGTGPPFAVALVLVSGGLLAGGLAPSMAALVAARVAQGLGAGAIPTIAYTTVGRAYPAGSRPRVFAVFSSAWVIPGVLGPAASSGLADVLGWRSVFLALLPLVLGAGAITLPSLEWNGQRGEAPHRARTGWAFALVAGAALVLMGLAGPPPVAAVALIGVGAPVGALAFVRLVPAGTLRLAPGLPAAVLVRGMLTFAFFGTDVYVSLTLAEIRGQPTWVAGAALTAATLLWTAGAWVQQRVIHTVGPRRLVITGFLLVAAGIGGIHGALGPLPVPAAIAVWSLAGLGMGLAYSPLSVTVLGTAEPSDLGAASASLQLSDILGVSLGTGLGGALLTLGQARALSTAATLRLTFMASLVVALLGAAAARRLPPRLRHVGHGPAR